MPKFKVPISGGDPQSALEALAASSFKVVGPADPAPAELERLNRVEAIVEAPDADTAESRVKGALPSDDDYEVGPAELIEGD